MLEYFFAVIAMVLIIEGMLPFISPPKWRKWVLMAARQNDKQLRIAGFTIMAVGVIILTLTDIV